MAMFQNLADKLSNAFKKFKNKGKLTEAEVKEGMREIKLALLEADVSFKVVKDFVKRVTERAVGSEVLESLMPGQQVVKIVHEELIELMGNTQAKLEISSKPPTVVTYFIFTNLFKTCPPSINLSAPYKCIKLSLR